MTVKLILHSGECRREDDPSIPYRLELVMSVPSFMNIAFICLHGGSEDVVARGDTEQELLDWMRERGLADHPRLRRWEITGPDGFVRKFDRANRSAAVETPEKTTG